MKRALLAVTLSALTIGFAACGGTNARFQPGPAATASPSGTSPFATLSFNVLVIGQSITNGWQCPTGVLTSSALLPSSRAQHRYGVHVATGGCDASGFPIPSPLPTPPGPTPMPLATLSTAAMTGPNTILRVPPVAGWASAFTFPRCSSGTCDYGTSNGAIAAAPLAAASASVYAIAMNFRNTGPESVVPPTPSPADRPSPHVYNLYGPPEPPGEPLQPVPVYVSGAPVTLALPTLTVTLPAGSQVEPARLRMTMVQIVTPPTYEEAIYTDDFGPIDLTTSSKVYAPVSTTATSATFAVSTSEFAFQTDFTEYEFVVAEH